MAEEKVERREHSTKSNLYGGHGDLEFDYLLGDDDLAGRAKMYAKIKMEPGALLGFHEHKGETETYYIVSGEGVYFDGVKKEIAKPGDVLLFTKPLGIGILTTAAKADIASADAMELAQRMMTTLNKSARDAMVKYRVHACTDVTGFGMLGHLYEMTQGSDVEAELHTDAIDFIPEALDLARIGILPEGMYRNRTFAEPGVDGGTVELCKQDVLYDPQTAGGLLMAVDPADAEALYQELKETVPSAQRIGLIREYSGGKRIFLK